MLKNRCLSGIESLILRGGAGGTFAVPREWTDRAEPSPYARLELPARLVVSFDQLWALAELLESIERRDEELDKGRSL